MKDRVITSIFLVLAIIPALFSIKYLMILLGLIVLIATFELNDLILTKKHYLLIAFLILYIMTPKVELISIYLLMLPLIAILDNNLKFKDLAATFYVATIIKFALIAIILFYKLDILILAYILIGTYLSDIGAFFIGVNFGKTKLAKTISPKKTVEGSLGGIAFGLVVSFIFGFIFLKQYFTNLQLLLLGIFIPIVGQIGDLFYSLIKREYNIKDFGKLFPGHGGILDRIDSLSFSLIFTLIFYYLKMLG